MSSQQPPEAPRTFFGLGLDDIRARIKEVLGFMPSFLKNPVEGIKRVPAWDWPTVIILQIFLAGVVFVLNGLLGRQFILAVVGLILGPLIGLAFAFIGSGIIYYAILFILRTELEFKKVFIVFVLAGVPGYLFGIISAFVSPILILSIIFSALLLIVGLTENFLLDRKAITKIVGAAALVLILAWVWEAIEDSRASKMKTLEISPDSLEILRKETEKN
jgi:hypothetical protein